MTVTTPPEALPRDPITDTNRQVTRAWRNYFENRTRRLGEVLSGLGWGATATETQASNAIVDARLSAAELVTNPYFDHPSTSPGVPFGWSSWQNGSVVQTTAKPNSQPGLCAYMDAVTLGAGNKLGLNQLVAGIAPGTRYILGATIYQNGGSLKAAGLYVEYYTSASVFISSQSFQFSTTPITTGATATSYSSPVRYELSLTPPGTCDRVLIYAMTAWDGFAALDDPCRIYWYECSLLPQTLVDELRANVTANNTAAAISGQGNLATANNARGTTAARATSTGSWSFYANTTTNTLQVDVPSSGWTDVATLSTAVQTRGKILGPAGVSFSANNTWQEVATVDVSDVPSGGVIQVPYVDVVGQSQSGPTIGGGYEWRLTEAPSGTPTSKTAIKSGAITISAGAGTDPPTVDAVVQPTAALVAVTNTGSVRYVIEVQRTSGTATIGLQLTANFIVGPS